MFIDSRFRKKAIGFLLLLAVVSGTVFELQIVSEILLSLALLFLLNEICNKYLPGMKSVKIVLISALFLRLGIIFYSFILSGLIIPSDAAGYEQTGKEILKQWLSGHVFFIAGGGESGKFQFLYYTYNAVCFLLFGINAFIPRIFNAFLGVLAGIVLFNLVGRTLGRRTASVSLALYIFFPSIVYFQTLNLKEAGIILMILTAVSKLQQYSENTRLKTILFATVASAVLMFLRIYLGFILIFICGCLFIYYSRLCLGIKVAGIAAAFLLLGEFTALQGYGIFGYSLIKQFNLNELYNFRIFGYAGGSQVLIKYDTSTLGGLLRFIPVSTLYFWFAPFFWQWNILPNSLAKFAALENAFFIAIFATTIISGVRSVIQRSEKLVILIVMLVAPLSLVYIISYGNMGLGLRMRDQMLPIVFIFTAAGSIRLYEWQVLKKLKS